jgi:hypothetical protein
MSKIITDIDIANQALGYLGEQTIATMSENTKEARQVSLHFDQTLREIMEKHRWSVGRKRKRMTRSGATPDFGWSYAHIIPEDCLRVLDLFELSEETPTLNPVPIRKFEKEPGLILSNIKHCGLVYIKEVISSDLSPLLVKALAIKLASKLAIPLGESRLAGDLSNMADNAIKDAWLSDARQSRSGENSDFLQRSEENHAESGRYNA